MELALSLGGDSTPVSVTDQSRSRSQHDQQQKMMINKDLRLICMGLGSSSSSQDQDNHNKHNSIIIGDKTVDDEKTNCSSSSSDPPLLQLDLLPFSPSLNQSPPPQPPPSHRPFPWLSQILTAGEQNKLGKLGLLDVKPLTAIHHDPENDGDEEPITAATANQLSPNESNSDTSSFQMDFSSIFRSSSRLPLIRKRDFELVSAENNISEYSDLRDHHQRVSSSYSSKGIGGGGSISDEDENGSRKKLRLTKEQSAFLEDSFKEHNTLNPKQKLILANQLNLRPRQVEVWFQNRRARTKLKQTEVDCEYLKTCCETLTEENRRLHKELQELRALKTHNSHPFYMQPPPTTLTMCPSCERVVTTTPPSTTVALTPPANTGSNSRDRQTVLAATTTTNQLS